jgi:hypothetical protein
MREQYICDSTDTTSVASTALRKMIERSGDVFFASIFLLVRFSFDASKENEQKNCGDVFFAKDFYLLRFFSSLKRNEEKPLRRRIFRKHFSLLRFSFDASKENEQKN